MTKSQLTIRLSSRRLDRRAGPGRQSPQTHRFNYRESPRITFIRAQQYVSYVLKNAVSDAGAGPSTWPSTHLVTLEVVVTDRDVTHSSVIQETLNGSALVLLCRYLNRFAEDVGVQVRKRESVWLDFNYQFYPLVNDRMARAVRAYFGRYE